ncbi:MAG: hypothetical protein N2255_08070 [Kiritimatiellae bacterium]|nr:hypothetical protein [Kiritimatiellia bacterium]
MIWDKSRLQRLTGFGVVMALLLAPTQYGLRLGKELYLSPVDPLIWGLFFLWVVGVVRNPDRQPIPRPPLFTVVFILIAAVSVPGAC